jgi:hypothetical protein
MPMSNADTPLADKPKPAPAAHPKPVPAVPALGRAAASGDAAVHGLLARRLVAVANGDTDATAEVDAELAKLGLAV